MSLADHYRAYCMAHVGHPYVWGAVPDDDEDPNDRDAEDCSGLWYGAQRHIFRMAGVPLPFGRETANEYWQYGDQIAKPEIVGWDYLVKVKDGHAHHIGCYVGKGQTVDARGAAYGVHLETVDYWSTISTASEVRWMRLKPAYRLPMDKLGTLTSEKPKPKWRVSLIATPTNARQATVYAGTLKLAPGIDVYSKSFYVGDQKYIAWTAICPSYEVARTLMTWLEGRKVIPRYAEVITISTPGVSAKLHDLIAGFVARGGKL